MRIILFYTFNSEVLGMKLQRFAVSVITCLFLLMFADACIIEGSWFGDNPGSFPMRLLTASSSAEENLNASLHLRYLLYECGGLFNRCIGRRHVDNMFRLDNGQLVSVGGNGDINYSVAGMEDFHQFCSSRKIPLLYVNLPKKYCRNEDLDCFGVADLTNLKADRFLSALADIGIDTLDIRPFIEAKYVNPYEAFFKTDHHWKISTGLYCAQILSEHLRTYDLDLAVDNIRDEEFSVKLMKNSWLGERGKKTGSIYSGLDDFELIKPIEETHFHLTIPCRNIDREGDFSIMLDQSALDAGFWKCRYGRSFYYSYLFGNDAMQIIENKDCNAGRILIIKDSFAQAVAPFLAMTAKELVTWDIRYNKDSLRNYIDQNHFDIVVVMYTESMINGTQKNRFMYDFS